MTKIRINTEQVRQTGRRLLAENRSLDQLTHELDHAINSLDTWAWDGQSRADAEPMLERVRPESMRLVDELDRLGKMLQRVADRFENEDNTAARDLDGLSWVEIPEHPGITLPPPGGWLPWPILPPIDIFPCPRWPWILPILPLLPFPLWPIILLPPPRIPDFLRPAPKPEPVPISNSLPETPSLSPITPNPSSPPELIEFTPPTDRDMGDTPYYEYGTPYAGGKYAGLPHPGIDIDGNIGDPIKSIGPGTVYRIGNEPNGYGHYIIIEHETRSGEKIYSLYAHLNESPTFKPGDAVSNDTVIGGLGTSGGSNDIPHLHLEVRTEQGIDPWRNYSDLRGADWQQYWLDPTEVIYGEIYVI